MRRPGLAALVVLPFVLAACSKDSKPESTDTVTQEPQATGQVTQESPRKGRALVTELPAGMEGVELADGGLRVKEGYEFVKDTDSTFYIARISTGRRPTGGTGSCRCTNGSGKCYPADRQIIVCEPVDTTCTTCGLAVSFGGVSTTLFIF